ncbi:MAG: electron transport complex subunit RsxC [Spirochaetae bacterium HGW-Spirochaetae-1]|nr:MAG: electron transport complex subunit RsxC [Spirochaetae bacterium HGW-Spirochaetae-1]
MFSSFRGGIHPPENKHITEGMAFSNLVIPKTCYIPMQQHIGAPARPIVKVGDIVEEGQLIGEATGFVSANVHASVPGKVVDIAETLTVYQKQPTVIIEAEGAFTSSHAARDDRKIEDITAEEILVKIRSAGIVGLGGAAFPTSVKLSPPSETAIDTLIVNGAECEPYLTVDDMLMHTFPSQIIEGIQITLKALGIKKAIVGVENNKIGAVKVLQKALLEVKPREDISVKALRTKYPQGAEKQLIYTLTGKEVPSRGLPMDVGIVVQNIGTVFAIREAVLFDKPLFERYITVSGKMINKPGNYKVRIGTRISEIVEDCGGLKGDPAKIIIGGPMCGLSVHSMDIPVVKGTSGILFLSRDEVNIGDFSPCIRCGKCVAACPMGLLPCDLGTAVENNRFDLANNLNPSDCIMCGSCSYSCPANRPLSHFIKLAQERIKQKK